jgi:hypothetical protein
MPSITSPLMSERAVARSMNCNDGAHASWLTAGLTRARELAVLVATRGALQTAVREASGGGRACCLQDRLRNGALAAGATEQEPEIY